MGVAGDHGIPATRAGSVPSRPALDHRRRIRHARRGAAPRTLRAGVHQGAGGGGAIHSGRLVALDGGVAARLAARRKARVRAQGHQALLPRHDAMEPADPARGPHRRLSLQYSGAAAASRRAGRILLRQSGVVPDLGLAGFVLASIAARFIFPAVSLEGRQMWLLRSSPLDLRALLWSKYWVGTVPLLVLALLLTGLTNVLLRVGPFMMVMGLVTICGLTFAIAALALGFGALYPQFETENAAQIPTSFGGLVYMMATIALLAAVIVALWQAVYAYVRAVYEGRPVVSESWMFPWFAVAALLCAAATAIPLRIGLRKMESFEF